MIIIDMSLDEVKKRIAEAWRTDQLGIQASPGSPCYYEYSSGRVCAVGAVLTDAQRQTLRNSSHNAKAFGALVRNDVVLVCDDEVETFLYAVQHKHDAGDLEKFRQFLVDNRVPIHG